MVPECFRIDSRAYIARTISIVVYNGLSEAKVVN